MARITAHAGAGYICGLIAAALLSAFNVYVFAACIVIILISFLFRDYVRLFMIMFSIGAICYSFALTDGQRQLIYDGTDQHLECTVTEVAGSSTPFYVCRTVLPDDTKAKIGLYIKKDAGYNIGDKLTVKGRLTAPGRNISYYRSRSVFLLIFYPRIENVELSSGILRKISLFRDSVITNIRGRSEQDPGQLLVGMLFGSRFSQISDETRSIMYDAGVGHIMAVSGLHLSLIASLISSFFSSKKRLRFAAVFVCSLMICALADFSVSSLRALVMIILLYAAPLVSRRSDPLTSLFVAVFAITLPSPLCVTSASFALSVSGVFGAGVLSGYIISLVEKRHSERTGSENYTLPSLQRTIICVLCASVTVLPVSALYFEKISLMSPLSNLLIVPIASIAVTLGALGCFVHLFSHTLSYVIFVACRLICIPVIWLSEIFGRAVPSTESPATELIGIAAVFILLTAAVSRNKKIIIPIMISLSALTVISQSVYDIIRPATIVYTEGSNAAEIITSGGNIFITDETAHLQPYKEASIIICRPSLSDHYRRQYPDAQLIECDAKKTVTAGEYTIYISDDEITAFAGDCSLRIKREHPV